MANIPQVDTKHRQAIDDSIRPSPNKKHLSPLQIRLNFMHRHLLPRSIPEDIRGMFQLTRGLSNYCIVKLKPIPMRYAVSEMSYYFCFRCMAKITICPECIADP